MFEKWKLFDLYNCEPVFQFESPPQWAQLHETGEPGVRFCETCQKSVYFCATPEEFVRQGELGRCVAISTGVTIKRELDCEQEVFAMGFVDDTKFMEEMRATMAFWGEVLERKPDLPFESRTLKVAQAQVEAHEQHEIERRQWEAEYPAKRAAREEAERVRQERQVKVRAALAKIKALSNREAYGQVGNCPNCGFSHRWDGTHCSHCGHSPAADAVGWPEPN